MTLAVVDDENYIKLRQLYGLCIYNYIDEQLFERILLDHFDRSVFNYQLIARSSLCQRKSENTGNTILHLMVEYLLQKVSKYMLCCDTLVKLGADFTIKNSNGYTPLLLAFNSNKIIDSLLTAHIQKNNATNICCKNGISHFHVACSSDQVEVVDFFLKSGVDVTERVNCDSSKFPGYTPLHFACEYCQIKTIQLLLNSGANWKTEDANGTSALHLLIKKLLTENKVFGNEKIRKLLQREIQSGVLKLPDSIGLTRLHLVGALGNPIQIQTELQSDSINSAIRFNSFMWPGQTPLHFAVAQDYSNLETVFNLIDYEADLLAKDAAGTTPLDLILQNFQANDIICILSRDKRYGISDLKLTNDLNLLNVLKAIERIPSQLKSTTACKELEHVNAYIPLESPLWPGFNLLHLAVILDKYSHKIFEKLLSQNFTTSNTRSTSPLHLAFRLKNKRIVDEILSHHKNIPANPIDQDNLSHLHIACAAGNNEVVKLLLKNGADPNLHSQQDFEWKFDNPRTGNFIRKGSTALHVAVEKIDVNLIKVLMSFQANPKATDADGVTPFQKYFNNMLNSDFRYFDNSLQMFELILESNPDQITNGLAVKLLNITIKDYPDIYKSIVLVLDRERRFKDWGLTRLQIACALDNLSMANEELMSGAEVNYRISCDSPLWPGDTAMHILFRNNEADSRNEIAKLLLDYGADPTIKNADNQTVIHLYYSQDKYTCLQDTQ